MDNVLICPSKIFITEELWNDEHFRDKYLIEMIETFEIIDKTKSIKLIWSTDLENQLWQNNKYRPWSEYSTTKNQLIPILYNFFNKNTIFSESHELLCKVIPNFDLDDSEIIDIYSKVCNNKILCAEDYGILISKNDNKFCSSSDNEYIAQLFKSTFDIVKKYIHCIIKKVKEDNIKDLFLIIEIYLKSKNLNRTNNYSFTKNFIKKIKLLDNSDLDRLFDRLALRISYTAANARSCIHLRDEFIDADNGYRIRITNRPTSKRVHYKIVENSLVFTEYYDIGEHDEGLQ